MISKNEIINDFVIKCEDFLDYEQQYKLKESMFIYFNNIDITTKEEEEKYSLMTIDDYNNNILKRFFIEKTTNCLSKNSLKLYRLRFNDFILNINKRLCDVTSDDIRYYLTSVKMTRNVSNTTLNHIRLVLSSLFSFMYDEEIIYKNPMRKISKIKGDTIKEEPLSKTDIELLRINCTNDRDRAIIEFLLSTGCRVSELCSVNRSQIDYYKKELTILGKGNKYRKVYLSDTSLVYIDKYLSQRKDNNEALFVSNNKQSKRLGENGIETILKNIGNKANVSNVHPHRFRRTLCCNLIDKGVDVVIVKDILGHSSLNTTMIYYNSNNNNAKMAYSKYC